MRDFNDDDRKKKRGRISLPENPGQLTPEMIRLLESAVMAEEKNGHISCPVAWTIATDNGVSKLDVGVTIDRLGIRLTGCQLGCFKVEKTPSAGSTMEPLPPVVLSQVAALEESGNLTCTSMAQVALQLGVKPLTLAKAANSQGHKIKQCQLGCF